MLSEASWRASRHAAVNQIDESAPLQLESSFSLQEVSSQASLLQSSYHNQYLFYSGIKAPLWFQSKTVPGKEKVL